MLYNYYGMNDPLALMAGFIRAILRGVIILCFLIPVGSLACLLLPPIGSRRFIEFRSFFHWLISGFILLVCRIKLDVKGPVPPKKVLILSNHIGFIEVLAFSFVLKSRIIAKDSLRTLPFIGFLMHKMGALYIDRKSLKSMMDVCHQMEDVLENGERVLFFPEGTTSRGEGVREPFTALLRPAILSKLPVYLASVSAVVPSTRWPIASKSVCWADGISLAGHLFRLLHLPSVRLKIHFGREPLIFENRKEAGGRIQKGILDLYEPMEQPDALWLDQYDIPLTPDDPVNEIKMRPMKKA